MKKVIKSLLLCICFLTTPSRVEGQGALSSIVSGFIKEIPQFTINSAFFLCQVVINHPQATAIFVGLAGSGSYGLYRIYNSEIIKKLCEIITTLHNMKCELANLKEELVKKIELVETNTSDAVKQECAEICKQHNEHYKVLSELLYRITGETQDLQQKIQKNQRDLDNIFSVQCNMQEALGGVISQQSFVKQKEKRLLDQMSTMVQNVAHLYQRAAVLEKRMHALQKLQYSMFHDMCYIVGEERQKQQFLLQYALSLQKTDVINEIPLSLAKSKKDKKRDSAQFSIGGQSVLQISFQGNSGGSVWGHPGE